MEEEGSGRILGHQDSQHLLLLPTLFLLLLPLPLLPLLQPLTLYHLGNHLYHQLCTVLLIYNHSCHTSGHPLPLLLHPLILNHTSLLLLLPGHHGCHTSGWPLLLLLHFPLLLLLLLPGPGTGPLLLHSLYH